VFGVYACYMNHTVNYAKPQSRRRSLIVSYLKKTGRPYNYKLEKEELYYVELWSKKGDILEHAQKLQG
jgi:hypothetical protein